MSIPFVQAKNFKRGRSKGIRAVVIHDMESSEAVNSAESAAQMCASWNRETSWHYAVDVNSAVQSVREQDTAWHATGVNSDTIGIEHAGKASQSRKDWLDNYSLVMLKEVSAPLVADICKRYNIPMIKISGREYGNGARGIMGHIDATDYCNAHGISNNHHWDPGPNFPWDLFITWVQQAAGQHTPVPPPPSTGHGPTAGVVNALRAIAALNDSFRIRPAKMGESSARIRYLQELLNTRVNARLTVDGSFGPKTLRAVTAAQAMAHMTMDGIVGPKTIAYLTK